MEKVIAALTRQLKIEEGKILSHQLWKNQMETFGQATTENQVADAEYVRQIKDALKILNDKRSVDEREIKTFKCAKCGEEYPPRLCATCQGQEPPF